VRNDLVAGQNSRARVSVGFNTQAITQYQWQVQPGGTGAWISMVNGPVAGLGVVGDVQRSEMYFGPLDASVQGTKLRCEVTNACGTVASADTTIALVAPPTCNDIDFNNDGSYFDPGDIEDFFLLLLAMPGCKRMLQQPQSRRLGRLQ
jgi:hypothetical protein